MALFLFQSNLLGKYLLSGLCQISASEGYSISLTVIPSEGKGQLL